MRKTCFCDTEPPEALIILQSLTEITSLVCQQKGMLFYWLAQEQVRI